MDLWLLSLALFTVSLWQPGCGNTGSKCETLVISPTTLTVKHGDLLNVSCEVRSHQKLRWEAPLGRYYENGRKSLWTAPKVTEWKMAPRCYYTTADGEQCWSLLNVTVYKPPDSVSISYVNHSGPVQEGHQYTLRCRVEDVAPVEKLIVTFHRGNAKLGSAQSRTNPESKPVNETFTVNITSSKEDDGVQYWCEARLDLGPQGPTPPPVVRSQSLTPTVYYKPQRLQQSGTHAVVVTEGETVQLNCSADANPAPAYAWKPPYSSSTPIADGVLTISSAAFEHKGQYTCVASNDQGNATVEFYVDVRVDLQPILAGLVALTLAILLGVCVFVFMSHYRQTRTGRYRFRDVLHFRKGNDVAWLKNGT